MVFNGVPNICFLFSISDETEFLLQSGHILDVYSIQAVDAKEEGEEELVEEEE
jgi:hypothetical protein